MINLLKQTEGSWEFVRGYVRDDLETIETILNARWGATFGAGNILPPAAGGSGVTTAFTPGSIVFAGSSGAYNQNNARLFWDNTNFRLGINTNSPTAQLHIGAGSAGAATAPLKLSSGPVMTAPEAGALEFTTDDFFATITTGAARKAFILDNGARLTSGRVPIATTNGRLADDADMTFAVDTLTVTKAIASTSLTVASLTGTLRADSGLISVAAGVGVKSLFDHFADSTVGGAEADIYSDTLAASQLANNGEKIIANYDGNFVTVGTELTDLFVYFGGTQIYDSTGVAPTSGTTSWRVYVEIIRVSSSVIRYTVSLNTTGASGYVYAKSGELTGLTLSNTNVLKITGSSSGVGSGSGDIVGRMGYVKWVPAA